MQGVIAQSLPSAGEIADGPLPADIPAQRWGWFPALLLCAACGSLGVAVSFTGGRYSVEYTEVFFWIGLLLIFLPVALRLAMVAVSRSETVACVLVVGLALYLVKVLHSPERFTLFDELLHWHTANNIARSGHLFAVNSFLPVSPIFTALENTTNAVQGLTGLSIYGAGICVIGATRIVLSLALYLLLEELGGSVRLAGIGTLLYMANANFLFFDAQFAYESFALPFAIFTVYAIVRGWRVPLGRRAIWTAMALLTMATTVTSHHVTSYILVIFLVGWTSVRYTARVLRLVREEDQNPLDFAVVIVLMAAAWLVFAASIVVTYLAEPVGNGLREFARLVSGEQRSRELFKAEGGYVQPRWEQLAGYASVLLVLGGLLVGVWIIWRRYRAGALSLTFALGALAYPATLALRFTTVGAEISGRTVAFLFLPISYAIAVAVVTLGVPRTGAVRGVLSSAFAVYAGVIFVGGIVTGFGPSVSRLPGPYLVSADSRSIEPEGLGAAAWMRATFGPDNRIAADRINGVLMGTYGEQYTVTDLGTRVDLSPVFFSPVDGGDVREVLHRGQVAYLVIDRRITLALPLFGFYLQPGENEGAAHTSPVDRTATDKFDRVPGVSRLFDSGNIVIYDVRRISGAR